VHMMPSKFSQEPHVGDERDGRRSRRGSTTSGVSKKLANETGSRELLSKLDQSHICETVLIDRQSMMDQRV
jgi:hypothetical protein